MDAAQTAGSYPIDVESMNIDLLAFPGHKGLLGPLGTGGLWVRSGLDLQTLREGGTGSFSEEDRQVLLKERFEHPHPRVQQRMEVLWLISQELAYPLVARLAGVSEATDRRKPWSRSVVKRSAGCMKRTPRR